MDVEFIIPEKPSDLCNELTNQYYVSEVLSVSEISDKVSCFPSGIGGDDLEDLLLGNFDVFFSILENFSDVSERIRNDALYHLTEVLKELGLTIDLMFDSEDNVPDEVTRLKYRNLVKMNLFLICSLMEAHENMIIQSDQPATLTQKPRKRKTTGASKTNFDEKRKRYLKYVKELFSKPIRNLWDLQMIDRKVLDLVLSYFFKILESPTLVQDQYLTTEIFTFMGLYLPTYNMTLWVSLKMIHMVQDFAHLPSVLSDAVGMLVKRHNMTSLIQSIFSEVEAVNCDDATNNTSRMHNLSQFLIEITEKCTEESFPYASHLLPCLSEESHIIRNCFITIIGILACNIAENESPSSEMIGIRNDLLKKLMDHLYDTSAYVRSKCLQTVKYLFDTNAMPVEFQTKFLEICTGHLLDKACAVRKSAIQVLKASLLLNECDVQIPLEQVQADYKRQSGLVKRPTNKPQRVCIDFSSDEDEEPRTDDVTMNNGVTDNNEVADENAAADVESEETVKQTADLIHLERVMCHLELLHSVVSTMLSDLLYSSTITDVLESVNFLVTIHQLGAPFANDGVKAMLHLVSSQEPALKAAVVAAFKKIHFSEEGMKSDDTKSVQNLLKLVIGANDYEAMKIQEIMKEFVRNGDITKGMMSCLWEKFTTSHPPESVSAIILLTMLASENPDVLMAKFGTIVEFGFPRAMNNFQFAKEICNALLNATKHDKGNISIAPPFRLAGTHSIFIHLSSLLIEGIKNLNDLHYMPMAKKALEVIFKMCDSPQELCTTIFHKVLNILLQIQKEGIPDKKYFISVYSRFLSLCGNLALMFMIHCETDLFFEFKRRNIAKKGSVTSLVLTPRSKTRRSLSKRQDSRIEENKQQDDEAEDEIIDFIEKILQIELSPNTQGKYFLGSLHDIVVDTCKWQQEFFIPSICTSAIYALAKFMTLNPRICKNDMPILLHFMTESPSADVRCNMIVAIADLIARFPNVVEPWILELYERLNDHECDVKKTALIVLTHLILHDMVKVRAQITNVALCIVDPTEEISRTAKFLFSELSKKKTLYTMCYLKS